MRQSERERLEKELKQEKANKSFKSWLKQSLIKEKREMEHKRIEDYHKRIQEDEQKKAKETMKVMAKIAYKEWKERKTEENRH